MAKHLAMGIGPTDVLLLIHHTTRAMEISVTDTLVLPVLC